MGEGLSTLFQNLFNIRPEETKRTGLAFLYLFFAIGAFIVGRIARTVLFLEIPDYREQLPLVYVLIAVTVSTTMFFYTKVERKLRRDLTNAITLVALIIGTLGFRLALDQIEGHGPLWAFYIWIEIVGGFLVIQFWTLTNEIFNSRQAKRLFAVIGGGGVLSNIVFGLFISRSVRSLGTENLLYILCACLAAAFVAVLLLGKDARPELKAAQDRKAVGGRQKKTAAPPKVFASRHVQLIAVVIALTYLVSTLVDYQFQVIIGDSIPLKDDRSAFFGTFFAVTGMIGGVVQFFFTARLLERFGVLVALILLPIAMLFGSIGLIVAPIAYALWVASYTKGSEVVLRYTVNDTTLQLLYLPLPAATRGRAKAVIDGMLKPMSIGVAGLTLALLVGQLEKLVNIPLGFNVDVYGLAWVVAGALVLWILTLLGLRREYLKSLVQTLQRRRLNLADATFQINDQGTVQVIQKALVSTNVGEVLHGLELLGHVSPKMRDPLAANAVALLNHESEDVRVAALNFLGASATHLHGDSVRRLLEDPSDEVRASATLALCAIEEMAALERVRHMLEDPDLKVRACAVAGLIQHGGLDGVLACADLLKKMFSSERAEDRERAAWVLGEVGVENFYQPLIPLFDDPDEKVRLSTIVAAGRLKSDQLTEQLIEQLSHPRLAGAAVHALASSGPEMFEIIADVLGNKARPSSIRAQAPKILARLHNPGSAEVLVEFLQDEDPNVRTSVVQSLAMIRDQVPGIRIDGDAIGAAARAESQSYFELLAVAQDLRLDDEVGLLADALQQRQHQVLMRLLALLGLKYPAETMELVRRNLRSTQTTTRANAVEVLDNLLANEEKAHVIPLVEDAPPDRKLEKANDVFDIQRTTRLSRLEELLSSKDQWLRLCAAVAAGAWKLTNLEPRIRELLDSENAVARETALYVLQQLHDRESLEDVIEKLKQDAAPTVRRYAEYVAQGVARSGPPSFSHSRPAPAPLHLPPIGPCGSCRWTNVFIR